MRECSLKAVIFYIVFKISLCTAKQYVNNLTDMIEDDWKPSCDTTQDCEEIFGYKEFTCIDNSCTCEDRTKCLKSRLKSVVTRIGQSCVDSVECLMDQSFCNKGKCQCIDNTVSSNNKLNCLNVSFSLGSSCEEDVQCTFLNGICKNQACNCSTNMHRDKGICFKNAGLGFPCQRDEECSVIDFSSCISDRCSCNENYIKSEDSSKCLLKAKYYNFPCTENIQCWTTLGSGAVCSKGFCVCSELYQYRSNINKCVLDKLLGESCGNHVDCHQPGAGTSRLECIIGVCKCKPSYMEMEGFCLQNSTNGRDQTLYNILLYIVSYAAIHMIM